MRLRRTAGLLAATVGLTAATWLVAAAPASACQPESCPNSSPVCQLLKEQPRLPQCIPVY
jgi:hypothetical protein